MPATAVYDLQSPEEPRLSGISLRLITLLMDLPLFRIYFSQRLVRDNGIEKHRQDSDVMKYPLVLHPCEHQSAKMSRAYEHDADHEEMSIANGEKQARHVAPPGKDLDGAIKIVSSVKVSSVKTGFQFWSVFDFHHAYEENSTTPIQVTERIIRFLKDSQAQPEPMNIMASFDETTMLKLAAESAARWENGQARGVLDGVPVAVKDDIDVEGYLTNVGTTYMSSEKSPSTNATAVSRLLAQGVIIIGKTNMVEYGLGINGNNPHTGTPRNPYSTHCYTGGSSSGSAAAVASGLCPIALGTDAGGSIRIPAGWCGLIGLKPTFGRIPTDGYFELSKTTVHAGVLASNVMDTAVSYFAMAGASPDDALSIGQPRDVLYQSLSSEEAPLEGLKIGIFDSWSRHASSEVVALCESFLTTLLSSSGATKVDITIPNLDSARIANMVHIITEAHHTNGKLIRKHWKESAPHVKIAMFGGKYLTVEDYMRANRVRGRLMNHLADVFQEVDVVMTPCSAIAAPNIPDDAVNGPELDVTMMYTAQRFVTCWNVSGHPAITIPVAYTTTGLPVSIQLIAKHWEEGTLLKIAKAVESLVERQKPKVWYNIIGE